MTRVGFVSRAVAALAAMVFVASGCTGPDVHDATPSAPSAPSASTGAAKTTVSVTVTAGRQTLLRARGVTVTLPAGSVRNGASVSLTLRAVSGSANGLRPLSDAVEVATPGALRAPARVTIPAPATVRDGSMRPVVMWQARSGGWVARPTSYRPGAAVVTASTDHFSFGFLSGIDVGARARGLLGRAKNLLLGRAGVAQPNCDNEADARRAGVRVSSDTGDRIKWCFGRDGRGQQVLKVANNTRTWLQIDYPATWRVLDGFSISLSADALARNVGALGSLPPRGHAARIVDGGDTVAFAIPKGASGRVGTEISTLSWLTSALMLYLDVRDKIVSALGSSYGKAAATNTQRTLALFGARDVPDEFDGLRNCLEGVSQLTEMTPSTGVQLMKFAVKCGAEVLRVGAEGVAQFAAGTVLAVASAAVSAVATAFNLLVTGTREIVDEIAGALGGDNAFYAIVVLADGSGRWTGSSLLLTGTSLGAVRSSMSIEQAAAAAGTTLEGCGDGSYCTPIPGLTTATGTALCLGVRATDAASPSGPRVVTSEGVGVGVTITELTHVYGDALHHTPGRRSLGGYYEPGELLDGGWWVADNGGWLRFTTTDGTDRTPVAAIVAVPRQPPAPSCGPPN